MGIFMIVFVLLIILIVIYQYFEYKKKVFLQSKGILYVGNGITSFITNTIKGIGIMELYNIQYQNLKSKNMKVGGGKIFGLTSLIVQDPALLRSILVKDFDHFANRSEMKLPKNDVLFNKMLVSLQGEKWKALRGKLSPCFTTGKIKRLFYLFDQSAQKLVKYLEHEVGKNPNSEMDISEGYSKFTMDIIASAVCGIDSKAFDQKEPSLFEKMGMKLQLNFGGKTILKLLTMFTLPKFADFLGLSFWEKDVQDFFTVAIKSSIHDRQVKKEKRNDFLQLMLETRENKLTIEDDELDNFERDAVINEKTENKSNTDDILDDIGIVANSVLFMLAGYDTTQSLLIFCAYSLALHQDIQDKLRAEVNAVLGDNDGEFSYDTINKMTYLDMVINETLRFYPPAPITDRSCTMEYKIPGTEFILKKGDGIIVPTLGLQHDAEYFPEPELFNPERFSPENKHKINQYAFLAFGAGGRNCIGRRFALAEVKVAISHLVHNFKIEPSQRTLIPMKYSKSTSLKPEGGMFLALHKIDP